MEIPAAPFRTMPPPLLHNGFRLARNSFAYLSLSAIPYGDCAGFRISWFGGPPIWFKGMQEYASMKSAMFREHSRISGIIFDNLYMIRKIRLCGKNFFQCVIRVLLDFFSYEVVYVGKSTEKNSLCFLLPAFNIFFVFFRDRQWRQMEIWHTESPPMDLHSEECIFFKIMDFNRNLCSRLTESSHADADARVPGLERTKLISFEQCMPAPTNPYVDPHQLTQIFRLPGGERPRHARGPHEVNVRVIAYYSQAQCQMSIPPPLCFLGHDGICYTCFCPGHGFHHEANEIFNFFAEEFTAFALFDEECDLVEFTCAELIDERGQLRKRVAENATYAQKWLIPLAQGRLYWLGEGYGDDHESLMSDGRGIR